MGSFPQGSTVERDVIAVESGLPGDSAALRTIQQSERVSPRWKRSLGPLLGRMFGLDLRSLALLRIVLATIVLVDLAGRARDLRLHYTDDGVLTREVLRDSLSRWRWSLGFLDGGLAFQQAVFVLTALAAISLLVGFKTRFAIVLVWALMLSIQVRNPLVLSGADTLLRVLLFWGMLLPLGAVWSIDHRRGSDPRRGSMQVLSFATAGLCLQVAFVYWFTVALKSGLEWRESGTALFYALRAEQITTPLGEWAQQFTSVLRVLTFATIVVEIVAPILLFSPIWTARARMVAIVSLIGMHIGIMLTMNIGIFPWTGAFCMLAFLPAAFWDEMISRIRRGSRSGLERLDQVTHRIERGAEGAFSNKLAMATATRAADVPGQLDGGTSQQLSGGGSGGDDLAPDTGSGRRFTYPVPSLILNASAAFLLVFIFLWNMTTVSAYRMPDGSNAVAYTLGIYQKWNMFAPRPPTSTIWYVMVGTLRNGEQVALLRPILNDDMTLIEPVSWNQPTNIAGNYYKDKYWRKYFDALGDEGRADERRAFATFACREWNASHAGVEGVRALAYVQVSERTMVNGDQGEPVRHLVDRFNCG